MKIFFFIYRSLISPLLSGLSPSGCRFEPSCSHYSEKAFQEHGFFRGFVLTVRRLSRCHPFGGSGWDPVPNKKAHS